MSRWKEILGREMGGFGREGDHNTYGGKQKDNIQTLHIKGRRCDAWLGKAREGKGRAGSGREGKSTEGALSTGKGEREEEGEGNLLYGKGVKGALIIRRRRSERMRRKRRR